MSLKAKLVSSVAAFMLVIALMVVGIFAANSATVQMGGTISFTASDVNATITLASEGQSGAALSKSITFDADDETATANWTDQNLVFVKGSDITVKITFTNNSAERAMTVTAPKLPALSDEANVTITSTQYDNNSEGAQDLTTSAITVDASTSCVVTIVFHMTDANNSVSGNWTANFNLANVA